MSIFSSYKKIFLLGFIVVILIAIPFSVYIAQQRQRTKSQAAASTTLAFDPASPPPIAVKVGDSLILNVVLDPGTDASANQVSFVKLSISFDPEKFTADSLKPNTASPNTLTSVLENAVLTSGTASISLSIGADPTKVLTTKAKIAVLKLKALSVTTPSNPSSVIFGSGTQVLSIASSDQTSENVLSTTTPATITIDAAPFAPSSTSTPTSPTTPTATPTPLPISFPQAPASQERTSQGEFGLSTGSAVFYPTPAFETQPTPTVLLPQEPLPPTGPGDKILGIGILGAIFTIIGTALFILL